MRHDDLGKGTQSHLHWMGPRWRRSSSNLISWLQIVLTGGVPGIWLNVFSLSIVNPAFKFAILTAALLGFIISVDRDGLWLHVFGVIGSLISFECIELQYNAPAGHEPQTRVWRTTLSDTAWQCHARTSDPHIKLRVLGKGSVNEVKTDSRTGCTKFDKDGFKQEVWRK